MVRLTTKNTKYKLKWNTNNLNEIVFFYVFFVIVGLVKNYLSYYLELFRSNFKKKAFTFKLIVVRR